MDAEVAGLIGALLVRAGMLMEDESAPLVVALPEDVADVAERVGRVERVGQDLVALAQAARVLLRRVEPTP